MFSTKNIKEMWEKYSTFKDEEKLQNVENLSVLWWRMHAIPNSLLFYTMYIAIVKGKNRSTCPEIEIALISKFPHFFMSSKKMSLFHYRIYSFSWSVFH